jgi:Uncharacterized conserved protein
MPKLDLKKEMRSLYDAPRTPAMVTVPAMNFLMIDGQGDPNGPEYMEAMEALFGMAYALKFMIRRGRQGLRRAAAGGAVVGRGHGQLPGQQEG